MEETWSSTALSLPAHAELTLLSSLVVLGEEGWLVYLGLSLKPEPEPGLPFVYLWKGRPLLGLDVNLSDLLAHVSLKFQDIYYFLRACYKEVPEKQEKGGLMSGQKIFQG